MQLSIFCLFGLKTPIHAPKLGFSWDFILKMRSNVNEVPKKHICGVLIMSLSVIVSEKSRGNKQCDKEEEEEEEEGERHIFGLFGIAVKWPRHGCMQLF